jgi:hypothetical protein
MPRKILRQRATATEEIGTDEATGKVVVRRDLVLHETAELPAAVWQPRRPDRVSARDKRMHRETQVARAVRFLYLRSFGEYPERDGTIQAAVRILLADTEATPLELEEGRVC